jgi:hypothetical protein
LASDNKIPEQLRKTDEPISCSSILIAYYTNFRNDMVLSNSEGDWIFTNSPTFVMNMNKKRCKYRY